MTNRERMLSLIKGEMPDAMPFAPRLDLWHVAARATNTLPKEYKNASIEDICRNEGWGIYRLNSDYSYLETAYDDWVFSVLGIYAPPETCFSMEFNSEVEVETKWKGHEFHVTFHTRMGELSSVVVLDQAAKKQGVTYPWIKERVIKSFDDWDKVGFLFENLELTPRYESYLKVCETIGEDGLVCSSPTDGGSPIHQIHKHLLPHNQFFILYKKDRSRLEKLAASVANFFKQTLKIYQEYPGELIIWGGNYDRTITFPPYFEKDILPWHIKVADCLQPLGKYVITHTDGENHGLMDIIIRSKVNGCESICPYPQTRLKMHEYREQWKDLVLIGGIPAEYLIPGQTSEEEMYQYLDYLFKAVAPGIKYIPGITDAVSPLTDFDRLRKLGNYIQDRGKLPLVGGKVLDIFQGEYTDMDLAPTKFIQAEDVLGELQMAVIKGDKDEVCENVTKCLAAKIDGRAILREGMITAMIYVGDAFGRGDMYIPEMLMAANAMEAGVELLKPALTSSLKQQTKAKVILGTVYGDLHDIGKNLVSIMLKGIGMEVIDLGINVSTDTFIRCVVDEKPDILALSALLTTTMPQMKIVIDSLEEMGIRDHIKIIVGGAPVTDNFAKLIGADGYAEAAGSAAALVRNIL